MRWKAVIGGRSLGEGRDDEELENAYEEGYRAAMKEMEGQRYGERDGYSYGGSSRGGSRGGYGQREGRFYDDDDDDDMMYGERRGIKGTGRYSRYRR